MFRSPASIALCTFAAALAYAVARYHVAGAVPWSEFPVYILLTALVWDAARYGKLFTFGVPSPASNLSMLLGVVAFVFFCAPMWATARERDWRWWNPMQRAGCWGLTLTGIHVAAMGYQGWLKPSSWPGYLPPITMISGALAFGPILSRRLK